jgi:hypothetical protein
MSVLDRRETRALCAELARITERVGTLQQLEGDIDRFGAILGVMLPGHVKERLVAEVMKGLLQ